MPRNIERDEKEAMRRKEQLMEAGFRLFFAIWDRECQFTEGWRTLREVGVATLI